MSTPKRLITGTGLTLGRVGVTIVGQIITVPIYLSLWDTQTFGIWLIFQGVLGYLILVSVAFQQYSYAELLQHGRADPKGLRSVYQRTLAISYLVAVIELAMVLGFGPWAVERLMSATVDSEAMGLSTTIFMLLALYSTVQTILMPFGAITGYALSVYSHFPRIAAWGLFQASAVLVAPALAVVLGGDLMTAGLALIGGHALAGVFASLDMVRFARGHQLFLGKGIDWRMGLRSVLFCLPLAGRSFIDSFRQQGFRLLLVMYAGPVAVTTLATTRTFANVLHQGLGTITAPLLPELMQYVIGRDQDRVEGAFSIVWLALFALLVPGVLLLCLVAAPIFVFWTRGSVEFDSVLFLTLLTIILVYAGSQPAAAILQGHNRIGWIIATAVTAAVGLVVLAVILVPPFGLRGAGLALLGAEICAASVTVAGANRTLRAAGLVFSDAQLRIRGRHSRHCVLAGAAGSYRLGRHSVVDGFAVCRQRCFSIVLLGDDTRTCEGPNTRRAWEFLGALATRCPCWGGGIKMTMRCASRDNEIK